MTGRDRNRDDRVAFRLIGEKREKAQRVADRLFDGNLSLLCRVALDEFVASRDGEPAKEEVAA